MNFKLAVLFVFVIVFSSCKREYASFQKSTYQGGNYTNARPIETEDKEENEEVRIPKNKGVEIASSENKNEINQKVNLSRTKRTMEQKSSVQKPSAQLPAITKKEDIKENKNVKKDRDPRYKRALIMTIFGGLATALGIIAINVAPTGLFIFIFGLVFIVGLVSLIMYWANPKPTL
jgi:hypothetical protein